MAGESIYLVDDSDLVRSMASMALETAGFRVVAMDDWQKLDDALQQHRPDLILLDVNMPELTGDFALSFFRETRGLQDVPLLLFSDIDVNELRERAEQAGADGYISKGWGVERLVEEVQNALEDR